MATEGKPIECRAAVAWKLNSPLVVETVTVLPPRSGEVRIKVSSSGVCHTDDSAVKGIVDPTLMPCIVGHEGAGIVESTGPGVTSVKSGDHVVINSIPICRECKACKNDKTNYCVCKSYNGGTALFHGKVLFDGTTRFMCRNQPINHFLLCSTFSEFTVTQEVSVAKVNPKASLEKISILGCAIPSGYGAAVNIAKVEPGSTCVVWGLGAIGLAAVMGCRDSGASRIIGVDINSDKFDIGKTFGCTEFINPKELTKPIYEVIHDMTGGDGADYTLECVGTPETMVDALKSCNETWGISVMVGVAASSTRLTIHPYDLLNGRHWRGGILGDYKGRDDISKLADMYVDGKLQVDEFITHTFSLDQVEQAFVVMREGKSVRSVIIF